MSRAQRRANRANLPRYERVMTKEQQVARLLKNGITAQDLEDEWKRGYNEGLKVGTNSTYIALYAAVMLAASEEFGFGHERAYRLIKRADDIALNRLTTAELCEEVYEKLKVRILPDEPFDRLTEV